MAEAYPPAFGAKYGELDSRALDWRHQALLNGEPVPFDVQAEGHRMGKAWAWEAEVGAPSFPDEAQHVPSGLGARQGLTPLEHVEWSKQVSHPRDHAHLKIF